MEIPMPKHQHFLSLGLFAICIVGAGCAGGGNSPATVTPAVTTSPNAASVRAGDTQTFSAAVTGTTNTTVTWSVNSIPGGNATVGTVSTTGAYMAPATVPSTNTVTIQAVSQAN